MKTTRLLALAAISLSLASALGQPAPIPLSPPPQPAAEQKLTKFNLDFPGGTPQELVRAIQKAMGKPLNAIIPEEHAQMKLPPLKMDNVDVVRLFRALGEATRKVVRYERSFPGAPDQARYSTGCGFRSSDPQPPTEDTIWTFYAEQLPPYSPPDKVCRLYALSSFLERGLTVDDITTAIQTGWKMLGDTNTPTINYHKDTKLLIAVGEPTKLETIDAVLKALQPGFVMEPGSFTDRHQAIVRAAAQPTPTPTVEKKPEAKPAEKKAEQ